MWDDRKLIKKKWYRHILCRVLSCNLQEHTDYSMTQPWPPSSLSSSSSGLLLCFLVILGVTQVRLQRSSKQHFAPSSHWRSEEQKWGRGRGDRPRRRLQLRRRAAPPGQLTGKIKYQTFPQDWNTKTISSSITSVINDRVTTPSRLGDDGFGAFLVATRYPTALLTLFTIGIKPGMVVKLV